MQAIYTKYLPATNYKGSRIKASCERGAITIGYCSDGDEEAAHVKAADALCHKFAMDDATRYASDAKANPWLRKRVCGGLPMGGYAHVFVR